MMNMRTTRSPPWDFIVPALISILTLILVHLIPQSIREFGALLGLVLVFLAPGYLLMILLFPAKSDLSSRGRVLMSIMLSSLLAALVSLILTFTPRGLKPASVATILSFFTLFLTAVAYARWSALPRRRRFSVGSERGMGKRGMMRSPKRAGFYALVLLILLAIAISFAAFALNNVNHKNSSEGNSNSVSESESWSISEKISAKISENFSGSKSKKASLNLYNNTSEEISENQSINTDDIFSENFSGNNASVIAASKNASVTMEQKRKVVILSVDEDGSDGSSAPAISTGIKAVNINPVDKIIKNGEPKEKQILEKTAFWDEGSTPNESDEKNGSSKGADEEKTLATVAVLPASKTIIEAHQGTKDSDSSGNSIAKSDTKSVDPSPLVASSGKNAKSNSKDDQNTGTSKGADSASSTTEGGKSQSSGSGKIGVTGGTIESSHSKTDGSKKSSGIGKEINSWVGTRSIGASEKSQTPYESKNIKYVSGEKGGRVVLGRAGTNPGSQSSIGPKKAVKLGR
jgi:hypothetical protein